MMVAVYIAIGFLVGLALLAFVLNRIATCVARVLDNFWRQR